MRNFLPTMATLAALAASGCGGDADQAARDASGVASEQAQSLSDDGQNVLRDAQALAGDLVETTEQFASERIDRAETQTRLDSYEQRAEALAARAQDLPRATAARGQLSSLVDTIDRSVEQMRTNLDTNKGVAELQRSADRLRDSARNSYGRLREGLPNEARDEIGGLVDRLGG